MSLPLFFVPGLTADSTIPELEEETMRHMMQVLRMKDGDRVELTNGKGLLALATISGSSKRSCVVSVDSTKEVEPPQHRVTIAISPLKNPSRFEWFLEKAAENGVSRIVPLLCARTEKQHIKKERWHNILVSAMLQSQQSWLTILEDGQSFSSFVKGSGGGQNYIAHCLEGEKPELQDLVKKEHRESLILIGPEGDFTPAEIELALSSGFQPVSLGNTRLRTETAGITAAVLLTHAV